MTTFRGGPAQGRPTYHEGHEMKKQEMPVTPPPEADMMAVFEDRMSTWVEQIRAEIAAERAMAGPTVACNSGVYTVEAGRG
jgi:hypothetical protein